MPHDPDALRDDQWERLRPLIPGGHAGRRGPRCDNRRFVDALLWMARSGSRWRDLPERYGRVDTVKRRYYRWIERGVLDGFLEVLVREHDRAGSSARSGGETRPRGADAQALGRSRGGLTTKIHIATDGLGNPVRMLFTPGQRADVTQGEALIKGIAADAVIADKGYDADRLIETIQQSGADAVIPPKSNRRIARTYDRALYKERNLVERFINKIKHFRRVATRYDKLIANYRGFVTLAAIVILMR